MGKAVFLLIAAISGITMAIQGTSNAQLSQKTNIWEATFLVHIIGTITITAIMLGFGVGGIRLREWSNVPWYLYIGGVLSVIIVYLVASAIPQVGVCNATTAIIIGQVSTAVLIDHLGLFGQDKVAWSPAQLIGLALFAAGAKLLLR